MFTCFFIIPGISWGIVKDLVDWYRKLTPPCELIGFRAKKKQRLLVTLVSLASVSVSFLLFPLSSY